MITTGDKKKILWICDTPNWAFDIVATNVSENLKEFYDFQKTFSTDRNFNRVVRGNFDLVICQKVRITNLIRCPKVIVKIGSHREFQTKVGVDSYLTIDYHKHDRLLKGKTIVTTNDSLNKCLSHLGEVYTIQHGLDLERFKPKTFPTNFKVGFVGNDLVFSSNGDLMHVESDEQHIEDTINADVSWWKENPIDGVGILKWIGAPGLRQKLQKKLRIELESDGYRVANPIVKFEPNGDLTINPNATI